MYQCDHCNADGMTLPVLRATAGGLKAGASVVAENYVTNIVA